MLVDLYVRGLLEDFPVDPAAFRLRDLSPPRKTWRLNRAGRTLRPHHIHAWSVARAAKVRQIEPHGALSTGTVLMSTVRSAMGEYGPRRRACAPRSRARREYGGRLTPALLITSSVGISKPLADPAVVSRYVTAGHTGRLRRRLESDLYDSRQIASNGAKILLGEAPNP